MGQMVAAPFAELAPRRAIPSFVQRTSLAMRPAKPSPSNPTSVPFNDTSTRLNSSRARFALWVRLQRNVSATRSAPVSAKVRARPPDRREMPDFCERHHGGGRKIRYRVARPFATRYVFNP